MDICLPEIKINATSVKELMDENHILRKEIRVARKAAEITAELVVKQFEETEKVLHRFQTANALRKAVLNSASQTSIIAANRESVITVFNTGAENLLGYAAAEIVGKQTPEIFHSESELIARSRQLSKEQGRKIEVPHLLFEYATRGQVGQQEWTYIRKDGTPFPVNMTINPLRDPDGIVNGFLCFATDISEKKRAEKALRESEEKYRLLIKNIPNIVYKGYADGSIDLFDNKIILLTGYSKEEFLSRKIKWTDLIFEADIQGAKEKFRESLKGDKSYIRQYRIRSKAGKILWVEAAGQIICDENGRIEYITGTFLDITERRQAEESLQKAHNNLEMRVQERTAALAKANEVLQAEIRERELAEDALRASEEKYRSIFENATEGIFQTTPDGRIITANPAFVKIIGYASVEEVTENITDLKRQFYVAPEDRDRFERIIKKQGFIKDFETRFYRKDRKIIYVSLSAHAVQDENQNILYYEGIMEDITQKKRAEELKIAKEAAEAATRAKSEFLANMSHEIRTPMNAVIGLTDLVLKTKGLTTKQFDYLDKIHMSACSLMKIINDILDFSKIEAGRLELESTIFYLHDVMNGISDIFAGKASEKGIEMVISIAEDVPCNLIGDPLRLRQILTNLTNNALKFTDTGEVVIQVMLIKKQADRVRLRFLVQDTGIGIRRDQLSNLFVSFSQADNSTTRKYGGTGLGLAISKRLAEMMAGEIRVESELGNGSSFYFTAEFGVHTEAISHKPILPENIHATKVLIVDDNETSRQIFETLLSSFHFEAVSVESGKAAIEELLRQVDKEKPYGLVLMDWMMPEMDGIAALKKIKADPRLARIPVLMMTAFGREEVMQEAESAGVDGFLIKPIKQSVLFDTIMDIFGEMSLKIGEISGVGKKMGEIEISREMNYMQHLQGSRVLLVEDNSINQQVASDVLSQVGIVVETASNGKEAVEKVRNEKRRSEKSGVRNQESEDTPSHFYDAVLMDVQMPVMDGYEATKIIRQVERGKGQGASEHNFLRPSPLTPSPLPIIAMTAHAMKGDRKKCLQAGMDDYVSKPINSEDLFSVLMKWIKPKKQHSPPLVQADSLVQADPLFQTDPLFQVSDLKQKSPSLPLVQTDPLVQVSDLNPKNPLLVQVSDLNPKSPLLVQVSDLNPKSPLLVQVSDLNPKGTPSPFPRTPYPGIDIPSALRRFNGNKKFFGSILKEFARNHAQAADEIRDALEKNDFESALQLAHTIKGVAGNLSANDLYEAAKNLEKGIRELR